MFFSSRIKHVRDGDRVLEIGPGSTPHRRANEFLEYDFDGAEERLRQRGDVSFEPDYGGRKVTFYRGERFPFRDGEFDYVIASHVIEHVENPVVFMSEICRVGGGRGYVEFPLPIYEYLYDFEVHKQFVWFDVESSTIKFFPKAATSLHTFAGITSALRRGFERGWDDVVAHNLKTFFFGIEFLNGMTAERALQLAEFAPEEMSAGNTPSRRVGKRLSRLLQFLD